MRQNKLCENNIIIVIEDCTDVDTLFLYLQHVLYHIFMLTVNSLRRMKWK